MALAALAVYANSFAGPFIFDDLLSIPQNPTIRRWLTAFVPPGGGVTVTGRPVLNLSFALNHALSGNRVWSYHALNLLIHLGAGLALFGIVRRTLRLRPERALVRSGDATFVAFAAALLWVVHPLQTESVTYVVQRAESLMGLFFLLTLYGFIRAIEARADGDSAARAGGSKTRGEKNRKITAGASSGPGGALWGSVLAVASCLLGMGTKEVMVTAPVLVLLYDRTFAAGSLREAWRRHRGLHLALAATWIPLGALVIHAANRGGTAGIGVGVGFWQYAVTQFQAVAHYLWLAVWPHPLIVDYGVQWMASAGNVIPYAVLVAALVAGTAIALWQWPAFGFLGAWFFAILAPTSLVPGTRQTLAEHRMYLALAPVAVLAAVGLHAGLGRRSRLVVAALAVGLGGLTVRRNLDYRTDAGIWADTVAKRPGNAYAQNNYGNILSGSGRPEEALAQYAAAIRLDPGYADAYYDAGNALKQLRRYPEAIARYEQALRINPDMPDAQTALGSALEDTGRTPEAIAHYEQALRINPNYADAHNDLGLALAGAGKLTEAIGHYEQALKIDPALPDVHNNLGNALRAAGRTPEAVAQFEQALRLRPEFAAAHNNLGNAYRDLDRLPEAIAQYEAALRIDPDVAEVRNNLGISLLMAGRAAEAIAQFRQALRRDPNMGRVHLNLAIALSSVGRNDEAAAEFEAARRLGARLPPMPPDGPP